MNGQPNENDLPPVVRVAFEPVVGPMPVNLTRSAAAPTSDQGLWVAIRNRTDAVNFLRYKRFIDAVLCQGIPALHGGVVNGQDDERMIGAPMLGSRRNDLAARPAIYGGDAYNLLKFATEVFLLVEAGVVKRGAVIDARDMTLVDPQLLEPDKEAARLGAPATLQDVEALLKQYFGESPALPYLRRVVAQLPAVEEDMPFCEELLQWRLTSPSLLELIWSYWHEEGMLVQTVKALAMRFENRRSAAANDPLANLELDPLRPLNNLLWGYIQDEYRQISVVRRAYEYDHHYGIALVGRAVPSVNGADSRSKFIEGFHNLLHRTARFFREDADTTVIADGFPLLNALREVHLLLAEGAHNQFGDLPWAARVQMLTEQWLLARPEMQEFLRGRYMVPYPEEWMGAVDAMKRLQGWTDTSITHFHNLAVFGERVLLSIRYGDWIDVNATQDQAKNWARYWRAELQGYLHSYHVATGVDLANDVANTQDAALRTMQPSLLLRRRLGQSGAPNGAPNGARAALPAPPTSQTNGAAAQPPARVRRAERRQ